MPGGGRSMATGPIETHLHRSFNWENGAPGSRMGSRGRSANCGSEPSAQCVRLRSEINLLHRGAIVDGWRASLSPHRGARERRGELVHRLCVQLRACRRRALGASPIRPTLADGRSPSSSISACSVFARLPCRIMDGRELSEGGTYEHPDIRHEEKLRY